MTEADILYRAYGQLKKALSAEVSSSKTMDDIAKAPEGESVTVTHNVCRVDSDWITEIERGLVAVDKALQEDRQFIRTDGEVKPIEKVKYVSKESIRHLSRHSDLITREQKEDIVPDKLYTVEKESDYAVYENKFLYLLLCRIRDFVTVRYEAIANAYKQYLGEYEVTKTVKTSSRTLTFTFKMRDEQSEAIFAPADDECADAIARMDSILTSVNFYMRSPIMLEVAKTDKIKGAITKTNVLLMNKNFSAALKLYDYLRAYEKDGYTIEKKVEDPELSDEIKRELAIPPMLSAFLVYEHSLGLEKHLQAEFEKEELRRAEEAQKELQRKLKALKRRIEKTGESVEQYILMLEERNAILENSYSLLQEAQKNIEELSANISRLKSEIELLGEDIDRLNAEKSKLEEDLIRAEEEHQRQMREAKERFEEEMNALKTAKEEEIAALKAANAEKIASLNAAHAEEIAKLKARAEEQYNALKKQGEEQLSKLKEAHKKELDSLRAEHKSKLEALQAERARETAKLKEGYERQIAECVNRANASSESAKEAFDALGRIQTELKYTAEERDILKARLTALRKEFGLLTAADDFTTEEGFNALEHEFEVLGKLLYDEWKNVKVMLRKEILGAPRPTRKRQGKSKQYRDIKAFKESENAAPEEEISAQDSATETDESNIEHIDFGDIPSDEGGEGAEANCGAIDGKEG